MGNKKWSKKTGKHLQFYMDCMKEESLPETGLCDCAYEGHIDKEVFKLISPYSKDLKALDKEGLSKYYWGSGTWSTECHEFTPLRQTIVLFMAAINNEL